MHVHPLDTAAGLPGVEKSAVDHVLDRVRDGHVGAHVSRILAAELQTDTDEALGRGRLHRVAGGYRTGEGDEIDAVAFDELQGRPVAQVQVLEYARRQTRLGKRRGEALRAQGCLRGVFQ